MKYLLVVGFTCNVYRREPRARLFFNEKLIDEFHISHHQTNKNLTSPFYNLKHPLEPYSEKFDYAYLKNTLPPLRFYHLDVDDQLQQAVVRIDIDNNDSNYSNGFITKSTLLQCKVLSLLPANRKIYEWFRQKARNRFISKKYAWHQKNLYNNFFNLLDNTTWIGKNKEKINNFKIINFDYSVGGSGSLHCELFKKYGILLGKLKDLNHTYIYSIKNGLHSAIYDKYEQHANQRNTN